MTDYMRLGDFVGHYEEAHLMDYASMSENACDGFNSGSPMSPMEMPGSPLSVGSDWSNSTATADYTSQPSSPYSEEYATKKPLKPSLKRVGGAKRPKMSVRWDPETVFETRPLVKRRRPHSVIENDVEAETVDVELKSPIPTKKAKIAELESQASVTTALHFLPSSISTTTPVFPEASRTVIPSFNFNSFVALDTPTANVPEEKAEEKQSPSSAPVFVPFSLVTRKLPATSSLLGAASKI